MRYTKEHKLRTRGRIVERASLALRESSCVRPKAFKR